MTMQDAIQRARGGIAPGTLQGEWRLEDVDALLRSHGASIRSVDNHHWQISHGGRSGVWLLGDGGMRGGGRLDPLSLERLQGVLRQTGLLQEHPHPDALSTPITAAILWVGNDSTRVYWINEQGLAGKGAQSISHWLHGEITLHRERQAAAYLRRILAMLERIERALLIGRPEDARVSAEGLKRAEALPEAMADARHGTVRAMDKGLDRLDGLDGLDGRDGGVETALILPGAGGLGCLTRLLELERPDLRRRVVAILTLDTEHLDDALLFSMAQRYLPGSPANGLR